jgi:RimJ/RimL family protein N-acetyltransferase
MTQLVDPGLEAARLSVPQPEIPAGWLTLRPWQPKQDAVQVVNAFRDPEIRGWHAWAVNDEADAIRWMTRWQDRWCAGTAAGWAITRTSDPSTVLGQVALRALYLADGMAECSYWVVPNYRGLGVATEATRALSDWAFRHLDLRRLEIVHSVRNPRSCSVALKAGFPPEGIKRSLQRHEWGGFHDMHLHARVRPAETPARAWDRALLDMVAHVRLWVFASLLSAGSAVLSLAYPLAAALPLAMLGAVPLARLMVVDRPLRKLRRTWILPRRQPEQVRQEQITAGAPSHVA